MALARDDVTDVVEVRGDGGDLAPTRVVPERLQDETRAVGRGVGVPLAVFGVSDRAGLLIGRADVRDHAAVAEVERGLALGVDDLAANESVFEELLLRGAAVLMVLFVVPRAVLVAIAELVDELDVPRPLRPKLLESRERSFRREATRMDLVVRCAGGGR